MTKSGSHRRPVRTALLATVTRNGSVGSLPQGSTETTIGEWPAGGRPRDLTKLKLGADALGISLESLCFGRPGRG